MITAFGIFAGVFSVVAGLMLLYLLGITIADRAREFEHRERMRAIELRAKQPPTLPFGGPIAES